MLMYILLCVLGLIFCYIYNNRDDRKVKLINRIPGPPGLPVIGNLLIGLTPVDQLWDVVRSYTETYYPTIRIWLGNYYSIVSISDPDDVETLLTSQKHIEKGYSYKNLQPWLKMGLLTSTGEKWRRRRKILTPAFHFNILKKYVDITNENAERFVEKMRDDEGDDTVQDLAPLTSKYTLNIICESAMGVALDEIESKAAEKYKNAVYTMGNITIYRITRPYLTDWVMNICWRLKKLQEKTLKTLHEFTDKVIMERKAQHKNTDYKYIKNLADDIKESEFDYVTSGRKKRLAMLDLLLSAEMDGLIDDDGIREEVDTFMFEGHDTTGMAMTFTLMLLAENEEIQEKARAEVIKVLTESSGKIGMRQLQEFNYLECCIKESLRLYPPVANISRYITEDLQLKKYLVPANTEVFVQLYPIHRDRKFWREPNKFDPDRFLPENLQGRHPFSYIPFSAGPRNCIGQKFALMELKSLIARILYNFKLEPIDRSADMKILLDIVIRPASPVRTRFVKINH
ncbi:cytochrome P450 4AB21 isoform X1 [Nasonia vitripennis]|uniref:Cytochrome P450 n=1 Tax=Nasonia vitripennis TaxID=7425 RepID=A0A7M7Q5F9_NASVI|nr:cytochrome P450 4AB21 precursor [Nasonia vitripennis]XP_031781916.1 cytochrome P450 4AB21 isoform X1 [Nasonia vitripennis]XP_031781917.1 cytochrome P450 4AB21 isoform X1 [Nasonia vitripennis]